MTAHARTLVRAGAVLAVGAACAAALPGPAGGEDAPGVGIRASGERGGVRPSRTGKRVRPATCLSSFQRLGSRDVAYAGHVRTAAVAYRRPGRGVLARFRRVNQNGARNVFAIRGVVQRGCGGRWYHVQLPLRPNGITGWVRARDVAVTRVVLRIIVDVSDRRVLLYRGGRRLLATTAAVGSRYTPTPLGRYYVNQILAAPNPRGPFGPGALGISAFSPVLTNWAQGGPIAIHGTNQPWSIGRAISNGCVRVPNPVLLRLFRSVPPGTPVLVRA